LTLDRVFCMVISGLLYDTLGKVDGTEGKLKGSAL